MLGLANALGAGFGVSGRRDGTESRQGGRFLDDEVRVVQAREAVQRLAKCVKEDPDPKVQKQTAWALAALYHSRFGGGRAARGGVSGSESGPPRRSLQGLPEEGAMRPLLTFLLTLAEGPGSEKGAGLSGRLVSESGHAASEIGLDQSAYGEENRREGLEDLGVLDTVTSALRCLQKAPRLPACNWGVLIRRLFRAGKRDETPRDSWSMQIRGECLRLAITHAREVPALAVFLDDTCELARLVTLETELQVLLLRGLAGVLRALPRSGGLRVLGDLQDLVMGHEDAQKGQRLQGALWRGLGEVLEWLSESEQKTEEDREVGGLEELRAAALEATKSLYRRLPVDVGSFRGAALVQRAGGTSKEDSEKGVGLLGAAVDCLAKTESAWLLELLKLPSTSQYGQSASPDVFKVLREESEPQLRAVVARVLLARVSHLQLADLKPCRKWLLERLDWGDVHPSAYSHPPSASSHSRNTHENPSAHSGPIGSALEMGGASVKQHSDQQRKGGSLSNQKHKEGSGQADLAGALEELVGVLTTARGAEKREWFMETLDWTLLAGRPLQGLTFTSLLCNAWLPSSSPFLSNSPSEALANLPYTLPAVLDDPDSTSDTPAVVQKLTSILTKGDGRTRCILLPCLVGCREKLSSDTWQYVAGLAVSQSIK